MSMKNIKVVVVSFLFFCFSNNLQAQKTVQSKYYGGHGCIDKSLLLYSDSTFLYEVNSGLFIATSHKKRGAYLMTENSITLYTMKRLHFLIIKPQNKYCENTFRLNGTDILMYSTKDEKDKDASFTKAYNTMWLAETK
jgi:hypothetical protein